MDSHAQFEIREYANVMAGITKAVAPHSYEAFEDYILNSVMFSGPEMEIVGNLLSGIDTSKLEELAQNLPTKREGTEFLEKMKGLLDED